MTDRSDMNYRIEHSMRLCHSIILKQSKRWLSCCERSLYAVLPDWSRGPPRVCNAADQIVAGTEIIKSISQLAPRSCLRSENNATWRQVREREHISGNDDESRQETSYCMLHQQTTEYTRQIQHVAYNVRNTTSILRWNDHNKPCSLPAFDATRSGLISRSSGAIHNK